MLTNLMGKKAGVKYNQVLSWNLKVNKHKVDEWRMSVVKSEVISATRTADVVER